jgi:hypothetical protein
MTMRIPWQLPHILAWWARFVLDFTSAEGMISWALPWQDWQFAAFEFLWIASAWMLFCQPSAASGWQPLHSTVFGTGS